MCLDAVAEGSREGSSSPGCTLFLHVHAAGGQKYCIRELDGTRLSGVSRKDAYLLTVQGHTNQGPRNLGFFCFFLQSSVSYHMYPHARSSANTLPRPASSCGHKTLADGETGEGLR